ncbi:hypothetical protein DIE23_07205 [Burkholderia sp. Bp9143]|nr:hypothetical protein DIE23_07205 [Burkholderia sp. Bp9143]
MRHPHPAPSPPRPRRRSACAIGCLFFAAHGYLKHLLGFIGLTDISELRVEGVAQGADAARAAMAKAGQALHALVEHAA